MPQPKAIQLDLTPEQRTQLAAIIREDWSRDSADLEPRTKAFARWYKLWRNATDIHGFPEHEQANFSIPLILWQILARLAKELDVLFGEESEIIVNPIGKLDTQRVEKVKRWMNWRVKVSLRLFTKFYANILHKLIYGTSIAFHPWRTKTRKIKQLVPVEEEVREDIEDPDTGLPITVTRVVPRVEEREVEVVVHDGPDYVVENLEDWVVPVTARAESIEDLDHFIRRVRLSVDEILDLRDDGTFDADIVNEKLEDLRRLATGNRGVLTDVGAGNTLAAAKAEQHGEPEVPQGREEKIVFYNWFGKFRIRPDDERAEEVVAFFQPDLNLLFGAMRLVDKYPDGRRPFIVSRAIADPNKFWGIGMCEILEPVSNEMDAFHRLATEAAEFSLAPPTFYQPASGINPEVLRLEPKLAIPTADVNSVRTAVVGNVNFSPYVLLIRELQSYAERLTAITDPQLGRQFQQANAPRTFGQQILLQTESNIRLLLDIRLERESMRELLSRIWEMDKRWLPDGVFFRVTEEDPGDVMMKEDFQGEYDFDIGPTTAVSNRAQRIQEMLQALQIVMPLGMPQVILPLLKKILTRLGQADVAALLPDIKDIAAPQNPEDENVRMLQGEVVQVHPLDNHAQHIAIHQGLIQRIEAAEQQLPGLITALGKANLIDRINAHVAAHQQATKNALSVLGPPAPLEVQPAAVQAPPQQQPTDPLATARAQLASLLNTGGLNIA